MIVSLLCKKKEHQMTLFSYFKQCTVVPPFPLRIRYEERGHANGLEKIWFLNQNPQIRWLKPEDRQWSWVQIRHLLQILMGSSHEAKLWVKLSVVYESSESNSVSSMTALNQTQCRLWELWVKLSVVYDSFESNSVSSMRALSQTKHCHGSTLHILKRESFSPTAAL